MSVSGVEWGSDGVSVSLSMNGAEQKVRFRASGGFEARNDFLVPLLLLPAMDAYSDLRIPGEVSPRLLSSTPEIQDVFHAWRREYYGRVSISANSEEPYASRPSGVACLFSGGVDSFYSALKHQGEVTHLILVHGFDLPLTSHELRAEASRAMRAAAGGMGKELIEVETDLRYFSDPRVSWEDYHGGALASVALLFQHMFRKVVIPSSHTYAHLFPWGSHPVLDPLWSTESMRFVHDGCEATRVDKMLRIGQSDAAMKHLRVCFENRGGAYNCGKCEKCLRTMVNLRATGNLKRCETFPDELNLEAVSSLDAIGDSVAAFVDENLSALRISNRDPDLEEALSKIAAGSQPHQLAAAEKAIERQKISFRKLRNEKRQLKERHSKLKERNSRLAQRSDLLAESNAALKARLALRRHRIADRIAEVARRIPGISRLIA